MSKFVDISKIITRNNWTLTKEEEKLYDDNNYAKLPSRKDYDDYESTKNFYLAVIRMKISMKSRR